MSNRFDYDPNKLSTTDATGHRIYLFPEDVSGIWKKRRTSFYTFLIFVYLVLPWIYFRGHQAILLDIGKREFSFFGYILYAHDTPIPLLLFLLGFIFTIGYITSIWGRVWCGWACPQTVFIDPIYRAIERMVEGKARARMKLAEEQWSINKIFKKSLKWFLFTLVSLHIAHSLLGYFVGTRELLNISFKSPEENLSLFITMLVLTSIFLFDFGWFREQFCIIACPYGRIQSVIMDSWSKVIGYDKKRGEPRRSVDISSEQEGDCINCYHCVKVCPTGIDIRNGTQLECIACTACIDACDDIMEKIGKEPGLIRYASEAELENTTEKRTRFRSFLYLSICLFIGVTLVVVLSQKTDLNIQFVKLGNNTFSRLENGLINNFYKLRLDHKHSDPYHIKIMSNDKNVTIKTKPMPIRIKTGTSKLLVHLSFPQTILVNGNKKIVLSFFNIKEGQESFLLKKELTLVGPFK